MLSERYSGHSDYPKIDGCGVSAIPLDGSSDLRQPLGGQFEYASHLLRGHDGLRNNAMFRRRSPETIP